MSLPANVGFGRVTGRLIRAILDSPSDAKSLKLAIDNRWLT